MKLELILPYIDPEQLPWDYRELIEIVGLEKTLEIAARCGGTYVYLEKLENILLPAKRAYIQAQRRQDSAELQNVRQWARDLDVSQVTVYELLKKPRKKDSDGVGWQQEELL